jgi:hypothetical protein
MRIGSVVIVVMLAICSASAFSQYDPFDSYGAIPWELEKARLDNFAVQLQRDNVSIGYIIVYAGRRSCVGEARDHALRAKKYLIERRGIIASRIQWMDGGYREGLTVVLQPAPRSAPKLAASPTLKRSEVLVVKKCKRQGS